MEGALIVGSFTFEPRGRLRGKWEVMRIDGQVTLSLPEAAHWLGLTVPCVAALVDRGELSSLRDPDGSVRIPAAALIEWAGQRGTQ